MEEKSWAKKQKHEVTGKYHNILPHILSLSIHLIGYCWRRDPELAWPTAQLSLIILFSEKQKEASRLKTLLKSSISFSQALASGLFHQAVKPSSGRSSSGTFSSVNFQQSFFSHGMAAFSFTMFPKFFVWESLWSSDQILI